VDKIIILHHPKALATKRHVSTSDGVETQAYGRGHVFSPRTVEVASVEDLSRVLTSLEGDATSFVVRGGVVPSLVRSAQHGVPAGKILRRRYRAPLHTDDPVSDSNPEMPVYLLDTPRQWLGVDLDDVEIEGAAEDPTPAQLADYLAQVEAQLPKELRNASYHYQWSASAGVRGWSKARLHLWYWMTEPVGNVALRRWAFEHDAVDHALYNPVQPHYTATPLFMGMSDPVPVRSGLVIREHAQVDLTGAQRAIDAISAAARSKALTVTPMQGADEWGKAKEALACIDPDEEYHVWLQVGQALHNEWPSQGLTLWEGWSAGGGSFKPGECARKWRTFGGERGVRINTLYGLAQARGWEHPAVRAKRAREEARDARKKKRMAASAKVASNSSPAPTKKETPVDVQATGVLAVKQEEQETIQIGSEIDLGDGTVYEYGHIMQILKEVAPAKKGAQPFFKTTKLATDVEPLALTYDVQTRAKGVLYRYKARGSRIWREATVQADAWVCMGTVARDAAADASHLGVRIQPRQGMEWCAALGYWAEEVESAREVATVRHPGWHTDEETGSLVYVAGDAGVFGADWHWAPTSSGADKTRCAPMGDGSGLREVCTTPGLHLALALGLGGAILEPMRAPMSFGLNFWGGSSSGKSIANKLSAGVWGVPDQAKRRWRDTVNGLEFAFGWANSACIWIDDLKDLHPRDVSEKIHALSDGTVRLRGSVKGGKVESASTFHWKLTAASSAETPLSSLMGRGYQGGHGVRLIDIQVIRERSDTTTSAGHARTVDQWTRQHAGSIGARWARHLQTMPADHWDQWIDYHGQLVQLHAKRCGADGEALRILENLAYLATALEIATHDRVLDVSMSGPEVLDWALTNVLAQRGTVGASPEERLLVALRSLSLTSPVQFPTATEWKSGGLREVVAIREVRNDRDIMIHEAGCSEPADCGCPHYWTTSTELLASSGLPRQVGCDAGVFLRWMRIQGRTGEGSGKQRKISGSRVCWWRIDLSEK